MTSPHSSLITAFDYVWDRLTGRIVGMDDAEYFWEPAPGGWSLRPDAEGHWRLDGDGGGGPAPDPVPVTSIAWRLCHIAGPCLAGFTGALFGGEYVEANSLDYPGTVAGLPEFLDAQYQAWRAGLVGLDDAGWRRPLGDAFGLYATSNAFDLALHVFDEVGHHGGEVGLLRDLYANRVEPR